MFRKSLLTLALLCSAGVAHAGDKPLYEPAPAWVKPAPPVDATRLSDADPVIVLFDQQQRLQDGDVWSYIDTASRIATPQMLTQVGTLPIPWDPANGDLRIHKVEIIRGAERIDLIAGGARFTVLQREQQLEQASLNGLLTATLSVEGLRVGDVLHVSFSINRKDPALKGHVQTLVPLITAPMRLQFGRARVLWPASMNLQWRSYLKDEVTPVDVAGGYRELSVALPLAKPAEIPDDAPLRFRSLPLMDVANYADWSEVSRSMAPFYATDAAIAPGSPLAAEVARIAGASSDPRMRTAMALQLVQEKVRYLFRGMEDGNYVPQAAAFTWSARYGDCKAKSLLLTALLRALGVEAEPVLVNANMGDLVSRRLPMPGAFNHVIVRATIAGQALWLDGTAGGGRVDDLDDVPPFDWALPLRPQGADLTEMPRRPATRPKTDAEIEVDASAGIHFPMPYTARITVRGQTAELLRLASAQSGKEGIESVIDAQLTSYLGQNEAVDRNFEYDDATSSARIKATGILYSDWAKDSGRYKVQLDKTVAGLSFAPDRARVAWRDIPVSSGSPDDRRVRMRIHLPDNGAGFVLEGDRTLPATLAGVVLRRSASLADGWVITDDWVSTGVNEIAPADIPTTRAQLAQAKTRLLKAVAPADYPAAYRIVEKARKARRFDGVLAIYARQIAEKPDEARGYTVRAWFLESIYDRAGAVRDLDKALALAPDADTYVWRARLLSALNQDGKAMADAKAALQLDPSSATALNLLVTLTAEAGKRDEAIAMVDEHVANSGEKDGDFATLRADLVAGGGKVDEAIGLVDTAIAAKPGNPSLLNSRCWLKGTHNVALDTALKDCTRSIELSENPAPALDSRAMVYFRMNRFDDALTDLDAALETSPDMSASLFMRGIIRKRTGAAGADEDLAAARLIDPRVDKEYAAWGIAP